MPTKNTVRRCSSPSTDATFNFIVTSAAAGHLEPANIAVHALNAFSAAAISVTHMPLDCWSHLRSKCEWAIPTLACRLELAVKGQLLNGQNKVRQCSDALVLMYRRRTRVEWDSLFLTQICHEMRLFTADCEEKRPFYGYGSLLSCTCTTEMKIKNSRNFHI